MPKFLHLRKKRYSFSGFESGLRRDAVKVAGLFRTEGRKATVKKSGTKFGVFVLE